jgi:3-oxoacyl-[acyl-carrier-protein] synthase-3
MPRKGKARIVGLGSYLPKRILTNKDLEQMVDTSDEWIVSRTGMKERRIAEKDECTSDMGFFAAQKALKASGSSPDEIDLIIVATMTGDYITPATAPLIQAKLKACNAAAVDIQAACTGYLYGLSMAKAYVESKQYRTILLIASEKMSSVVNYKDRNTCVLFGDGASAAVIKDQGKGLIIDTVCLGADGELAQLLMIPAGGSRSPATEETVVKGDHFLKMEGKEVFKHAVRRMVAASKECLTKAGLTQEQVGWIIPHQANLRIIEAIAKNFNLPTERVYKIVHKYGNTSASSVAIALDELIQEHSPKADEHLLLVAFGAGLTWAAAILTTTEA